MPNLVSWSERSANAYDFLALGLLALLVVGYPLGIFERVAILVHDGAHWGIVRLGNETYYQHYAHGAVHLFVRVMSWALLPAVLVRMIIEANFAVRIRHYFILPVTLLLFGLILGAVAAAAGAAFLAGASPA